MRKRTASGKSTSCWRLSFWRFSIGFRIITALFHKSVTVVDTISTTVIFYSLLFWECFWHETGDISNISGHKQIVYPDLMRPWSEKTGVGKMTIVIRI